MTWIGKYRRNLITFRENSFYLLSWGLCSVYISVLTLVCVRQNVAPKVVFWLYNSVQLVFIDIGHGLVIPWRMGIPWRAELDDKERPKQFYVLKPPELRIGRFDKMATQRPAPTPPPPSLCSSTSCSTSPSNSPSSQTKLTLARTRSATNGDQHSQTLPSFKYSKYSKYSKCSKCVAIFPRTALVLLPFSRPSPESREGKQGDNKSRSS